ncbi:MAG: rod shape-determining protein RodA [Clostridia bacterium]|nr:rod shape-determining protein RodA [Clostridia bacterium]
MTPRKNGHSSWLDPWLTVCTCLAFAIGFVAICSATKASSPMRYCLVQGSAFVVGCILLFLITRVDYDAISQLAVYFYICNVVLLILVLLIGIGGTEVGTRGWIRIGPVGIQPSEIVKIGFIITFAKHIESVREDINRPKNVLLLLAHAGLLIGLILLQPDTGTAMVFAFIMLGMLFTAGISLKYLAAAAGVLAIAAPLAWFFFLQDFQKDRILTFLNPELDPLGSGYHVIQSKIAVGSGGVLGRGIGQGIQTQHGYLPETQTDFIYAVIGEEMGLWGCILVLVLLTILIIRCFQIAAASRDSFGEMIAAGVGFMFIAHVFESIGMCIGLLPVTGIPLPFVSYGGSNLLASMLAVALVTSVGMRRKRNF